MASNHNIFKFDPDYPTFETITKNVANNIVAKATKMHCPCIRDDDAELILNNNINNSKNNFKDPLAKSKAGLAGSTRFPISGTPIIFYNLPSPALYQKEDPIYWFARHIENIYHECRHINDFSSVFCDTASEKARFSSLLHFVASNNPGFDRGENGTGHDLANYSHNINEIRAELYGINQTTIFLKEYFPNINEKHIADTMLKLINDKIKETEGHYCLCLGQTSPLKTIDELPALIKKSINNAYKQPFAYTLDDSNLRRDLLARCLSKQQYNAGLDCFQKEKDPFEQARMMATITLCGVAMELSPEIAREEQNSYLNLQNIDLSIGNFFNSCFSSHSIREAAFNAWKTLSGLNPYIKQPFDKSYKDDFDDFDYI